MMEVVYPPQPPARRPSPISHPVIVPPCRDACQAGSSGLNVSGRPAEGTPAAPPRRARGARSVDFLDLGPGIVAARGRRWGAAAAEAAPGAQRAAPSRVHLGHDGVADTLEGLELVLELL